MKHLTKTEIEYYLQNPIILGKNAKNIINYEFNRLIAILPIGRKKTKSRTIIWLCKCSCGNYTLINANKINTYISCGCYNQEKAYKGTKSISGSYFCSLKNGAKLRSLEFNITIQYLQELLEQQNYKCAISGLSIDGARSRIKYHSTYSKQTASLDRIDNTKGYIIGNVQWVHQDINYMKQDFTMSQFLIYCEIITKHNKEHQTL